MCMVGEGSALMKPNDVLTVHLSTISDSIDLTPPQPHLHRPQRTAASAAAVPVTDPF